MTLILFHDLQKYTEDNIIKNKPSINKITEVFLFL